jgi:hypothetical protein
LVKVGVGGADLDDPVLAHQGGGVEIVDRVPAEPRMRRNS